MENRILRLPATVEAVERAVEDAGAGEVVLVVRDGRTVAAVVSHAMALAGEDALLASADAGDRVRGLRLIAELGVEMATVRLNVLRRELAR
ncbi:hypothetical protein ACFCYH_39315 [Streptomyces sp. NPDC056400]|uniref:hypothetical protein n=1 Tax=unclassified Streptomyces TaxID=2593676 RepID=UPI0035E11498